MVIILRTIYADVFFFINMFVDYSLLLCVKRIIHSNVKQTRIISGALAGAALSFCAFLPFNNFPLNIIIGIISLSIVSFISFGYKNHRLYLKNTVLLITVSFLFSGALIFFYTAFKPDGMIIINNAVYFNISPVLLIVLSLIIYFILFIFKKAFNNHADSNLMHNIRIYYSNIEYLIKCKVDSGCNVKEPFSGNKVIIVDSNAVDIKNDKKVRLIPFTSLGGKGILKGYKADKVLIDDKIINEDIYIGLCDNLFKTEIKGLIPANLLEE